MCIHFWQFRFWSRQYNFFHSRIRENWKMFLDEWSRIGSLILYLQGLSLHKSPSKHCTKQAIAMNTTLPNHQLYIQSIQNSKKKQLFDQKSMMFRWCFWYESKSSISKWYNPIHNPIHNLNYNPYTTIIWYWLLHSIMRQRVPCLSFRYSSWSTVCCYRLWIT